MSELEQAKNEPAERWNPSNGELYKSILSDASIDGYRFVEDRLDQDHIKFGNAFPEDMPLEDVVMLHQFINEMELICWQLGVRKPVSQLCPYLIGGKGEKICYKFDFIDQRDKAYSMLSYKAKDWLKTE